MVKPLLSAAITVLLVALLPPSHATADSFTREYMVKAGFIINLIRFTTWPESKRPDPGEPFRVGICGSLPAARVVGRALAAGKTVRGHELKVTIGDIEDMLDSHVIFIAGPVSRDQRKLFPVLHDRSVLTVGEDDGFLLMGGIVNFSVVEHRLVLDINKAAADSSDLGLSARLLQVSRTVVTSRRFPDPATPQER